MGSGLTLVKEIDMFKTTTPHKIVIFPFVTFSNIEGKSFVIPRERILHIETYQDREGQLDSTKTFVNFLSPNPASKGPLHAVVDMSVEQFYNMCVIPAYEGTTQEIS